MRGSHWSKDVAYIDALVEMLRRVVLGRRNLIYTTLAGLGVPVGKDIFDFLKHCFTDYDLYVIFAISKENYYASPPCLNKTGAAWVVGSACCPFLLPGTDFADMEGVLRSTTSAISLDRPDEAEHKLQQMGDNVLAHVGAPTPDEDFWESERDEFLRKVTGVA